MLKQEVSDVEAGVIAPNLRKCASDRHAASDGLQAGLIRRDAQASSLRAGRLGTVRSAASMRTRVRSNQSSALSKKRGGTLSAIGLMAARRSSNRAVSPIGTHNSVTRMSQSCRVSFGRMADAGDIGSHVRSICASRSCARECQWRKPSPTFGVHQRDKFAMWARNVSTLIPCSSPSMTLTRRDHVAVVSSVCQLTGSGSARSCATLAHVADGVCSVRVATGSEAAALAGRCWMLGLG